MDAPNPVKHGNFTKLRSSCDACSELKVRCGRDKPECARCVRRGNRCVYGRSRRSHRDAPKVGDSKLSSSGAKKSPEVLLDHIKSHLSPVRANTPAGISDEEPRGDTDTLGSFCDAAIRNDIGLGGQDTIGTTLEAGLYLEDSCLLSPLNTPSDFDAYFSSTLASSATPDNLPLTESGDGILIQPTESETHRGPATSVFGVCGCMTRAAHQIALISCDIPGAGQAWFHEQLSRIRQATIAAEDCISCHCVSYDDSIVCTMSPTNISINRCLHKTDVTTPPVTVCLLLGRILRSLSNLVPCASDHQYYVSGTETATSRSSTSPSTGTATTWSLTHPGPGDEEDPTQEHLALLQSRKLQAVMEKLGSSVRQLAMAPGPNSSTCAIASMFIQLWLVPGEDALKSRFAGFGGA
ncbi:hypothetical protein PG984_015195 [Apiospora sp. TS-2023a]